jgi:hypothetical protein
LQNDTLGTLLVQGILARPLAETLRIGWYPELTVGLRGEVLVAVLVEFFTGGNFDLQAVSGQWKRASREGVVRARRIVGFVEV